MKPLLTELRRALMATLVLALAGCGVYPLLVFALAQAAFPGRANGSLLTGPDGSVRGSTLIGQPFASTRYFHPRPSAAGTGYDAANSGGSNLGPTSRPLREALAGRIAAYRAENALPPGAPVPADAVTASGSGLDPEISPRNAALQAARVARARGLGEETVRELIRQHTRQPDFGVLGEPGVNVLKLNLALDHL